MKQLQELLVNEKVRKLFQGMRIGIEKESQRVTLDGCLAETPHPAALGSRDYHPYIQTDFSETQVEMITPVFETIDDTMKFLSALHEVVLRSMPEEEMFWPLSMPPVLPEQEKDIIIARLSDQGDVNYRRYLAKVYGKRKQMVSGIHYNFEFSPEFLANLFEIQTEFSTIKEMKTNIYLQVSRKYLRYRWLITYLFGAAPYAEAGYFDATHARPEEPVRSIRNSEYGYTNRDDVVVSYASIRDYIQDIENLVESGKLIEAKEFYSPIRLRGGSHFEDVETNGVNYVELRNIDLHPFVPYGTDKDTLQFIHLFIMAMLWQPESDVPADELLAQGTEINNRVALEHPLTKTKWYDEGMMLLDGMLEMAEAIGLPQSDVALILSAKEALEQPEKTLAGQMVLKGRNGLSNQELAICLGKKYHDKAHAKPYQLAGYRHMELSTQIFMFDVLQKGVRLEVLDETDQFLKLKHGNRIEYVKNANMTSLDSYIVPLIMENKTVTKKILAKAGFRVPKGSEFSSLDEAVAAYDYFREDAIVVKPKSTNYGIGITIFKDGATKEDYIEALGIAFSEDDSVLVEEFMPGTEYRFFVLDGETKAIMKRIPANVKGDGERTIAELVAEKNTDPLRGTHHRSPLEQIQLGDIEQLMLKEQGYTVDSVPAWDEIVYLRENSNVSTGGDSINITEGIHASYKTIAEQAVTALGAKICGIDLIIPDAGVPSDTGSNTYGIIEANFNPAMHMHIYPFAGESRRLTTDVLKALYPELY